MTVANCGKTMSDAYGGLCLRNRSPILGNHRQRLLNRRFRLIIHHRSRLIQNQNWWVFENSTSDACGGLRLRNPLSLSTRQLLTAFAHNCVIALEQLLDKFIGCG